MKPETLNGLEPNPEEQALQETVARLRASLTALLLQKDELLLIQCKRVESLYLRRFGALELKLYEAWCDCLRAKKKAKLIRVCRNRRQAVDVEQIEARLEEELGVYRQQLEQRSSRVFGALRSGEGSGLTSRGVKELKNLYRQAVKALHPDLHPGEEEARSRILQQAMRAYRSGDLPGLRTICESLDPDREQEISSLTELRAELSRLRGQIRSLDGQLEAIKSEYPMNMQVYLEDEARGKQHEAELLDKLREIRERTVRYEAEVSAMLAPEDSEVDFR
ncbi:MAG: J domain-containing protein [Oscillospiraceae bacterium]|nr:J domain-containing protein [Oscillospiraceae bacterium]